MEDTFKLEDVFIIIRRRILYFILPVLVFAPLGLVAVMLLPPKYAAEGTILVESQQIPEELISSTINSYAQERIQVIQQRVMTRQRLLNVADKYDVFSDRDDFTSSEKVAHMREALNVSLISVRNGHNRRDDATIAFKVEYRDRNPEKAYLVANEFITLFLSEDVRSRKDGASETTEFFEQEARRLRTSIDDLESRIATFKTENADALPEHEPLHMQKLDRATVDLRAAEDRAMLVDEERRALEQQLSSYLAGATTTTGPAQELAMLRVSLAALRADKTDAHPDVQAAQAQIASLERQLKPSETIQSLNAALSDAEANLQTLIRAEDTDEQAIRDARRELDQLRATLSAQLMEEASNGSPDFLVAQIQSRLDLANSRYNAAQRDIDDLKALTAEMQGRLERTPAVARSLAALTRDHQNLDAQYQQTQAKRQRAIAAENLEDNQKAEKFSILEPAVRPDEPTSPDRLKLSFLAIAFAFGVGGASAIASEVLMGTIRGREHLKQIMGDDPIVVIPYIEAPGEKRFSLKSFGLRPAHGARAPA